MRRRLHGATVAAALVIAGTTGASSASHPPILQRFLAVDQTTPTDYRALRHLEARSERMNSGAWMDVWTEADSTGFRYTVVDAGGSSFIRSHVFEPALETERDLWRGGAARGSITTDNYEFGECGEWRELVSTSDPGLTSAACIGLKPRRKDVLLVDGSIFLQADGDLMGIRGSLAKTPSFWTRRVDIVRRYARIAGVRVPVAFESVASVRFAGESTLTMTYQYERVNGRPVAAQQVAAAAPSQVVRP
jgi:hypothetical protein